MMQSGISFPDVVIDATRIVYRLMQIYRVIEAKSLTEVVRLRCLFHCPRLDVLMWSKGPWTFHIGLKSPHIHIYLYIPWANSGSKSKMKIGILSHYWPKCRAVDRGIREERINITDLEMIMAEDFAHVVDFAMFELHVFHHEIYTVRPPIIIT